MNFPEKIDEIKSDINVAPLVDVMLVLLVIFMITAPYYYNEINLDLPKTKEVHKMSPNEKPFIINLDKNGMIKINNEIISEKKLLAMLKEDKKSISPKKVFLKADKGLKYELVAKMLAMLQNSGIQNINLVTDKL